MNDDAFDKMDEYFERIDRHHKDLKNEFMKLAADPCSQVPKIGDTVLIAAGLVNKGHLWIRLEAKVLKCANTSYYVEYTDYKYYIQKEPVREWVHQNVITDVITDN